MFFVELIKCCLNKNVILCLLLLCTAFTNGQEICDNAIDDNGNGLIDLNDTTASCACVPQAPSLIPNPSFEERNCCPSSFSQMNCANEWVQASSATADYMNTCGMIFGAATSAGLVPFPDGNAIAGFISSIGYQEYIGACLTTPMLADSSYSLQMSIASTPITGYGLECNGGVISYTASDIVIYGSTDCNNLPFAGDSCPPAPQWFVLDSTLYTPVNSWGTISFTFTPSVNINAIIIGSPCNLPQSYVGTSCYPYFYLDNLALNQTQLVNTITQTGSWCANTTVLTGNTIPGATYQWYLEGVALVGETSVTLNVSGNNLPVGEYSLSTTVGGNCTYTSVTVIKYNNPPTISAAGPYCTYDPVTFLTANIAGGVWGGPGITDTLNGMFNPATAGPGSHNVYYTLPGGGDCPRSDTLTILVKAPPLGTGGPDTTICSEDVINVGGSPVQGYFYSWNPTTGLSNAFIANPTLTLTNSDPGPITANYSLIITDPATGCQRLDQLVVTVNPRATINLAGPFCKTDPGGALTASIPGGTWSGPGIINSSTGVFSPAAADVGNNTVVYNVTGGCGGGDTVIIVVTSPPVSNAGPDISVCSGTPATVGAPPIMGYTYSWQPMMGLTDPTISDPGVTVVNNGTSPVTTNFILTTGAGGCQGVDTVAVTINPNPSLEITNPNAVCSPVTVNLTAPAITSGTSGGGVLSYWMDSLATTLLTSPAAVAVSGTYFIKAANGSCTDIEPVTAIIDSSIVSDAGADITLCTGDPAQLGAASLPGYTYLWAPSVGLTSTTIADPFVTLTNSGSASQTYTYSVTTSVGNCSSTDTVNVIVNPLPQANAGSDQIICEGTVATLSGTITAAAGGTWSGGAGTYTPSATSLNAQYNPDPAEITAGSFTLILTTDDPPGSCTAISDTVVFNIIPGAVVSAGADDTICAGSSIILNGSFGGSATGGMWTGGAGIYTPDNTSPTAVYTPSFTETETGEVILFYSTNDPTGACSAAVDTVVITIHPSPVANAGQAQYVCAGKAVTLNGTISGSATNATWSGGAGSFSPNSNALNAIYTPAASEYLADSVVLTLTTNTSLGFPCSLASDQVTIYFYKNPVVDFSIDDSSGCPEHCVNFTDLTDASGGIVITSWIWNFGDNSPVVNTANASHCYLQAGLYDVALTVLSENGCSDTLVVPQMIQVFSAPVAEFEYTPNPATITSSQITLNDLSSSDVSFWFWDFGDGDTLTSFIPDAVHLYSSDSAGTYLTSLIVQNLTGCADTVVHPIVIYPEFSFYMPNAFTPNNDGVNDSFAGKGTGIESFEMMIFDRWGNLVFYSDELGKSWDGTINFGTEIAQQDTYVWKVKLTDVFRKKYNYIGIVNIIK